MRALVLLLMSFLPALGSAEALRVIVSVPPLKTFVERVGGEHVDVQVMVRPGHDPHRYDPTPGQIGALNHAALFVRTGMPFEKAWMARIRATNPQMNVMDARQGIARMPMADHDHGHDAHDQQEEWDPHVWTSPLQARQMVGNIYRALAGLAPQHAARFRHNHDRFVAELDALHAELEARLGPLRGRAFMVFHPAWGYFADAYGLVQVAIEHEGKEPAARGLVRLVDQARAQGIRTVFAQPQTDRRLATRIAREIGGRVVMIDPLATDYVDNLRRVAGELVEAMQP